MKNLPLPQHINMLRLSEHAASFHGPLLIKDMQRLAPSLYSDEGEVTVDLSFGADEEGTRFCRVQLKTEVNLQCQRCMEPFTYGIMSDFVHGIVGSESEAEALAEQYEPIIVQDGLLVVQDMVEDELILKMPIVPMHADVDCKVKLPLADSSWTEVEENGQSPFHVLKLLKRETK
jgi:uncharacterized protein